MLALVCRPVGDETFSTAEETGWEFHRLLEEMRDASDFYFDDVSQIRMDHWSNGRVALVGEAACGPTLITGQGTSSRLSLSTADAAVSR
jgi:2-polyprenyl-6-methoxyphenol hydroxylase-like FAD-dependent oxidoreductase